MKQRARFCTLYGPILKSTRTVIMPNGCCGVYGCSNRLGHSLPKDTFWRKQWQIAVRMENFTPTGSSIVCKIHFLESDYHVSEYMQEGMFNFCLRFLVFDPCLNSSAFECTRPRLTSSVCLTSNNNHRYDLDQFSIDREHPSRLFHFTGISRELLDTL